MSNDTDADGDVLTVTSAGAALHGTTVLGANGSITYTPATNYHGPDTFTYGLSDNQGGVSTGTVTVTVTPVERSRPSRPTIPIRRRKTCR